MAGQRAEADRYLSPPPPTTQQLPLTSVCSRLLMHSYRSNLEDHTHQNPALVSLAIVSKVKSWLILKE